MKISGLIKKLKYFQELYGDLDVKNDQVRILDTKIIEFYEEGENPF